MKYRKKQVVIDARQWDGTWDCALAIKNDFMGGEAMVSQLNFNSLTDSKVTFIIPTEDGEDYWVIATYSTSVRTGGPRKSSQNRPDC